ncbi:hypothetical protein Btru_039055 [Bulinus truncatus]|nr:hypothetical protein Btru_039055 [Bulinus truncatus]
MSGLDRYVITGSVDNSDIELATVIFEKSRGDFSDKPIVCTIDFTIAYKNQTSLNCYCTPTPERNIFNIALNLKVKSEDSNAKIRAYMLIKDAKAIYSETVTLPTVLDFSNTVETYHLQIDGQLVEETNCTLTVESMTIDVLLYSNSSTLSLPVEVSIHDGTKAVTVLQNMTKTFQLSDVRQGTPLVLNFTTVLCSNKAKSSVCLVQKVISGSTLSSYEVGLELIIPVSIVLPILVCLFAVGLYFIWQKKRSMKKSDQDWLKDIEKGQPCIHSQGFDRSPKPSSHHLILLGRQCSGKSKLKKTMNDYITPTLKITEIPYFYDYETLKICTQLIEYVIDNERENNFTFLMVIPFGVTYDSKDLELWNQVKLVFGEKSIAEHSLLIITHADKFDPEETESDSIESWFCNQTGPIRDIMDEFQNKIVYFHNNDLYPHKIGAEVQDLMKKIDRLSSEGDLYNFDNYMKAKPQRNRLLVELNSSTIREKYYNDMTLIAQKMTVFQSLNPKKQLDLLNDLKSSLESMHSRLLDEDLESGVLHDLVSYCEDYSRDVRLQMEKVIVARRLSTENEKQEKVSLIETDSDIARFERLTSLKERKDKIARAKVRLEKEFYENGENKRASLKSVCIV